MTDVGLVYGACRERISELVRDLDDERAAHRGRRDPGLVRARRRRPPRRASSTDINAGKLDGIGTPARTAAQVADRRDVADRRTSSPSGTQGAPQFEAALTDARRARARRSRSPTSGTTSRTSGATLGVEGGRDPLAEQLAIVGYADARTREHHRGRARAAAAAGRRRRVGRRPRRAGAPPSRRAVRARALHLLPPHRRRRCARTSGTATPSPTSTLFTGGRPGRTAPDLMARR